MFCRRNTGRTPEHSDRPQFKTGPGGKRSVRSYALRGGRISPAQARAVREHGERWRLASDDGLLNVQQAFGRRAPLILEIGFGAGEALLNMAQNMPERNFLGVDVYAPGIGQLFRRMAARGIDNIRVYAEDIIDVLQKSIPDASLDAALLLFPDPWPKKRHHKRRLIQAPFLHLLAERLRPGAVLQIATDWESYAEQIRGHVLQNGQFVFPAEGQPPWRHGSTRFEQRARREGRKVHELLFERCDPSSPGVHARRGAP